MIKERLFRPLSSCTDNYDMLMTYMFITNGKFDCSFWILCVYSELSSTSSNTHDSKMKDIKANCEGGREGYEWSCASAYWYYFTRD